MNLPPGFALDAQGAGHPGAPGVPEGFELDQAAEEEDNGALEAAARGALRNFPLAQQGAAAIAPINPFSEKKTYGEEIEHLTKEAEASKAAHPVAYGAGAVAGTAAPLLIPGAGAALEAAPILGNAALGAAGSLSDANLTKPTMQDAKDAATAAAISGGIGALFKGAKNVLPLPTAEDVMAENTASGIGATPRKLLGSGMMGKNPQADLAEMGHWINTAGDGGESLIHLTDKPGEILAKVQAVHDKAGGEIGQIIDKISDRLPVSAARLKQNLAPILDDVADINPASEAKIAGIFKRLDRLEKADRLTFDSLQKLKSSIGKNIGDDPHMSRAYGAISEYMNQVVDAYGGIVKDRAMKAGYDAAKTNYKNASRLLPILRYAEAKDMAGGAMGNSGLLGMFGLGAGVAAGHPALGAASMAASAVGRPIVNQLGRNASLKAVPYIPALAKTLPRMSSAAQLELANALEERYKNK